MPKTSSRERLAAAIENMIEVLKNPHLAQPTLEEGTPTNDALTKLQQIFQPQNELQKVPRVGGRKKTKVYLPPKKDDKLQKIVEDEIFPNGTVVQKKFGKHIYRGTITGFVDDEEIYYIDYEDGDYQTMTHQEVKKHKCDNTVDKPRTRFTRSALNNKQQLANLVT